MGEEKEKKQEGPALSGFKTSRDKHTRLDSLLKSEGSVVIKRISCGLVALIGMTKGYASLSVLRKLR